MERQMVVSDPEVTVTVRSDAGSAQHLAMYASRVSADYVLHYILQSGSKKGASSLSVGYLALVSPFGAVNVSMILQLCRRRFPGALAVSRQYIVQPSSTLRFVAMLSH